LVLIFIIVICFSLIIFLLKFFMYQIWSSFFWLLLILFEIIYEILIIIILISSSFIFLFFRFYFYYFDYYLFYGDTILKRTHKRCYLLQPTDLKNSMKQSSGGFLRPLKFGYLIKERGLRSWRLFWRERTRDVTCCNQLTLRTRWSNPPEASSGLWNWDTWSKREGWDLEGCFERGENQKQNWLWLYSNFV